MTSKNVGREERPHVGLQAGGLSLLPIRLPNARSSLSRLYKIRRGAEAVERGERERAKELLNVATGGAPVLTIDVAAGRYWNEAGRHHADAAATWRDLERLIGYFGQDKLLSDVTTDDVTRLVAWRRGHRVRGNAFVSPATVNRSTTQVLQKLFTRAKKSWGMRFDQEPLWREHRLKEPEERVRELMADEAIRIDASMRPDYEPFFRFARASGARLRECLLRWSEVDWSSQQITKIGKGNRRIVVPITPTIRSILWPLRAHHEQMVFTYVGARTRSGRVKGQRYPITFNGIKTQWKRLRARAKIEGFRFHDFRHDLGTKLLSTSRGPERWFALMLLKTPRQNPPNEPPKEPTADAHDDEDNRHELVVLRRAVEQYDERGCARRSKAA